MPKKWPSSFKATRNIAIQFSFAETVVVLGWQWNLQYCAIHGLLDSNYWIEYSVVYEPIEFRCQWTRSSAVAEGPRDAPCQLKPCEMSHKCSSSCVSQVLQQANDIQGHGKWLESIGRDTSCWWCVVTTCLSCTISVILPLLRSKRAAMFLAPVALGLCALGAAIIGGEREDTSPQTFWLGTQR